MDVSQRSSVGGSASTPESRSARSSAGSAVGSPLEVWVALGLALGQPLAVSFSRPTRPEDALADAGHLEIQEYLLEIGRRNRRRGAFELPTRPHDPAQSIDVCNVDAARDCLVIQEAWNRIGDLGAAARGSLRKVAEMERRGLADRVALCWVVRDSHANHGIVRRYPEIIAARFTGSSAAWVDALENGAGAPAEPGFVWFDPSRRRLRPLRVRRH